MHGANQGNCALYTQAGGCPDDNNYNNHNAYAMTSTAGLQCSTRANQGTANCGGNWASSMDNSGWSMCNEGCAMRGLDRGNGDELHYLEGAQCCRISPNDGTCTTVDIGGSFNNQGWVQCPANKYMKGLHRTSMRDSPTPAYSHMFSGEPHPEIGPLTSQAREVETRTTAASAASKTCSAAAMAPSRSSTARNMQCRCIATASRLAQATR